MQIILHKFKKKCIEKSTLAQVKHLTSPESSSTREVVRRHLRHAKCTHCSFLCQQHALPQGNLKLIKKLNYGEGTVYKNYRYQASQ